jgi:hypothetical protein
MFLYEGIVVELDDNRFQAAILKLTHDEPGCDTVMQYTAQSEEEANIWVDDELNRLTCGKGIWDI